MRDGDPLMAYSLLPLPDIDRVLVTNSGMRDIEPNGHTIQLFRLSDLKLLATEALDPGSGHYGELNPEEARRGPYGGKIAVDRPFKDHSGRPGFDTGPRNWPHGWKGGAQVHGIVFSGT
jgi:hypothetical protein